MSKPTAKEFGELFWYLAAWDAKHEGYSGHGMQSAAIRAVKDEDCAAFDEANRYPYINRPKLPSDHDYRSTEAQAILTSLSTSKCKPEHAL